MARWTRKRALCEHFSTDLSTFEPYQHTHRNKTMFTTGDEIFSIVKSEKELDPEIKWTEIKNVWRKEKHNFKIFKSN